MSRATLRDAANYTEQYYLKNPLSDSASYRILGWNQDTMVSGDDWKADPYYAAAHLRQLIDRITNTPRYRSELTPQQIMQIFTTYNGTGGAEKYGKMQWKGLGRRYPVKSPCIFAKGRRKRWKVNRKKMKIPCLTTVIILAIVLLPLFLYAPYQNYVMNRIALVTSRGFVIPTESSLCEFRVLELNSGSGEWWIYGEDKNRYYFAGDGAIPHSYVSIRKDETAKCPGFNPIAFDTWCTSESPHEPNGG